MRGFNFLDFFQIANVIVRFLENREVEREMYKSKKCMGSVFGSQPTSFQSLIKEIRNDLKKENIEACDIGCLDGRNSFVIASDGFKVDCYEINEFYINGGQAQYPFLVIDTISLEEIQLYGLKRRLKLNFSQSTGNINVVEKNFYKENTKQYDFVYTRRSLSRKEHSDLSINQKIQILKNSVKEKGILYIEYLIETDEEKDPAKYLKRGQMEEYFNRKGWILYYCTEGDGLIEEKPDLEHPTFHKHNVGRVKVMKDKNKKLDFYKVNLIF